MENQYKEGEMRNEECVHGYCEVPAKSLIEYRAWIDEDQWVTISEVGIIAGNEAYTHTIGIPLKNLVELTQNLNRK